MAILGIYTNRKNPEFTVDDFLMWMPQYENFMGTEKGQKYFKNLSEIANAKIYQSVFGADWTKAMSLCIAHYLTLISRQMSVPSGDTLEGIAGGGVTVGVLSSATVGSFTKSYDLGTTIVDDKEAKWWNLTAFGAELYALLQTKSVASIMVVTSNPVPGAN